MSGYQEKIARRTKMYEFEETAGIRARHGRDVEIIKFIGTFKKRRQDLALE